jgi:hypothetical protein
MNDSWKKREKPAEGKQEEGGSSTIPTKYRKESQQGDVPQFGKLRKQVTNLFYEKISLRKGSDDVTRASLPL